MSRKVPEGWRNETIASLCKSGSFTDGDWIESKDQDPAGDIRLIQLSDIGDGVFLDKTSRFINGDTAERLGVAFLEKGDIILARMPDPLGRACIFPLSTKAITAVDVCILRPGSEVDRVWLANLLNSPAVRSKALELATGTTRKRISRKNLGTIEIAVPPLPEQRRIAEILSSVDEAIAATQAVIDQTRTVKQGVLKRLLTKGIGHTRFKETEIGEIPEAWEVHSLQDLCTKITDGSHQSVKTTDSGVPFLYVSCIRNGQIVWDKAGAVDPATYQIISKGREARKGCVLYTAVGSYGHAVALDEDYELSFQRHIAYLKPIGERLIPEYLSEYLNSEIGRSYADSVAVGNAQKTVTLKKIKEQIVAVPSVAEQTFIVNKIKNISDAIRIAEQKIARLKAIKSALMSDLLTGRKRVPLAELAAAQ